jgi:hypothetical protein
MKYIKAMPKQGDTKIIRRFAFLPITLVDRNYETKWLEIYKLMQVYDGYRWRAIRFIDKPEDEHLPK